MARKLLIPLLSLLLAAGLVACGGGNDEDPETVLEETFEGGKDYSSGTLDIDVAIKATGDNEGSLDATIKGPFQSAEGGFPQFDLTADVNLKGGGQDFGFSGGLSSTGDSAFVNFQDTDYEVNQGTFNQFRELFLGLQSGDQDEPAACTVKPVDFMTDVENEGTEDVEGTEAIHISGTVDVNKLIEEVRACPSAEQLQSPEDLNELRDSVTDSTLDVYTGADDKRLRKLDAQVSFEPPTAAVQGDTAIELDFSIAFGNLGEPQTISAPANARPLDELLRRYNIDLGALGSQLGAGSGGAGAGTATPTPPSTGDSNAYLECLQQAQGQEAIQACAEELQ